MAKNLNSASLSFIDFVEDSLLEEHPTSELLAGDLPPTFSRVSEKRGSEANPIDLTEESDDEPDMHEMVDGLITEGLMSGKISQSDATDIDLYLTQPCSSPVRASQVHSNEQIHRENGARKLAYLIYLAM